MRTLKLHNGKSPRVDTHTLPRRYRPHIQPSCHTSSWKTRTASWTCRTTGSLDSPAGPQSSSGERGIKVLLLPLLPSVRYTVYAGPAAPSRHCRPSSPAGRHTATLAAGTLCFARSAAWWGRPRRCCSPPHPTGHCSPVGRHSAWRPPHILQWSIGILSHCRACPLETEQHHRAATAP